MALEERKGVRGSALVDEVRVVSIFFLLLVGEEVKDEGGEGLRLRLGLVLALVLDT